MKTKPLMVWEEGEPPLRATGERLWKVGGKGKRSMRGALGCLAPVPGNIMDHMPHMMRQSIRSADLKMLLN